MGVRHLRRTLKTAPTTDCASLSFPKSRASPEVVVVDLLCFLHFVRDVYAAVPGLGLATNSIAESCCIELEYTADIAAAFVIVLRHAGVGLGLVVITV